MIFVYFKVIIPYDLIGVSKDPKKSQKLQLQVP